MPRILVVDDDSSLRRWAKRGLTAAGHDVEEVPDSATAIQRIQHEQFDAVLTDLRMSGPDGVDILRAALATEPRPAVIIMSGHGTIPIAVHAIQLGAFDFVQKPFPIEEIGMKIERALEMRRLKYQIDYLNRTQPDIYDSTRIVGSSGTLKNVLEVVRKVARSNATVLIRGETGTGKELIAAAVHHNSTRAGRAFVKVNCAALHDNLLESELFGHEKGAFTSADRLRIGRFEQADGGTLFLDEIGDMSLATQAKLLRVLQEREFERLGGSKTIKVDVRLLAATNRDLPAMCRQGRFREDLYYRLNVVSIEMPPLRDRKEDIPELADTFVRKFAGDLKKTMHGLAPDALTKLVEHDWPGNIRELENVLERAVLLTEGPLIAAEDLHLGDALTRRTP
jgi:two-component system response regulator HydG